MTSPPPVDPRRRSLRELGAGFIEYALLLSLIAFALLTLIDALGDDTKDSIDDSASSVASVG